MRLLNIKNGKIFLPMDHKIGFYPIVDDHCWLPRLAAQGVKTIQLRLKNFSTEEFAREVQQAILLAKQLNISLFINDAWQLAIEYGAYGVHLGQEDLQTADLTAIHKANLRLGVSSHNYQELQWVLKLQPSYIALGPIYHTDSKKMSCPPQGIERLKEWRNYIKHQQLVAIGGIDYDNMLSVLETDADGIAVISYVTKAENPDKNTRQAVELINHYLESNAT